MTITDYNTFAKGFLNYVHLTVHLEIDTLIVLWYGDVVPVYSDTDSDTISIL